MERWWKSDLCEFFVCIDGFVFVIEVGVVYMVRVVIVVVSIVKIGELVFRVGFVVGCVFVNMVFVVFVRVRCESERVRVWFFGG